MGDKRCSFPWNKNSIAPRMAMMAKDTSSLRANGAIVFPLLSADTEGSRSTGESTGVSATPIEPVLAAIGAPPSTAQPTPTAERVESCTGLDELAGVASESFFGMATNSMAGDVSKDIVATGAEEVAVFSGRPPDIGRREKHPLL